MDFDIEKYVKDKVEAHPGLEMVEHVKSPNNNNHLFIIGKIKNKAETAAMTTTGFDFSSDAVLKKQLDGRLQDVVDMLVKGAA